MKVKEINWSYPSSHNAYEAKHGKTGCWTLSSGEPTKPLRACFSSLVRAEVDAAAAALNCQWSAATQYCQAHSV